MANPSNNLDLEGSRPFAFVQGKPSRSAHRIGHSANDLITRGCVGKILAVVTNAAYLQTNDGEIFWFAPDNVPLHARGAQSSFDENELRVGTIFAARDGFVQIGERTAIDLRGARVWQPLTIAPSLVAPREVVCARVRLAETFAKRTTSLPIHRIAPMRDAKNIAAIVEQSKELIGLGAGLTPAGDDFVGGLLFAIHHLREAYALNWDTHLIDDLLNWARIQTNIISHTLLCDHAHGTSVEPLHDLMFALLARAAPDNVAECAALLARIGSSTGTEILAGALTGIQWIEDKGNWE